jgi:hypothetical protein
MIHVLEGGLVLEVRGNGGVVLLNCLDVLGSRRGLVFLIVVISLARKIVRSFVFVGRAKLEKKNHPLEDFGMNRRRFYPHIDSDQEHHACRMTSTRIVSCCGQK